MATYVIGDYIREIRLRKGYTQEDVSFGICTSATLSRIENGAQTPGRYILDKLMERKCKIIRRIVLPQKISHNNQ